jgi:hypothetical protein
MAVDHRQPHARNDSPPSAFALAHGRSSRPFHVACLFVNGLALGMVFGLVPGIWIGCKSGVIEERMAAIYVGPLPISHFLWRRS